MNRRSFLKRSGSAVAAVALAPVAKFVPAAPETYRINGAFSSLDVGREVTSVGLDGKLHEGVIQRIFDRGAERIVAEMKGEPFAPHEGKSYDWL